MPSSVAEALHWQDADTSARKPPPGAKETGEDRFGVFADIAIPNSKAQFRMRWIEPGTFAMGAPDGEDERPPEERPQHLATLTQGFWLADAPCTHAVYEAVVRGHRSRVNSAEPSAAERPIEHVSWNDAQRFCRRLNRLLSSDGFMLPTEAQWEYACRAGTTTERYDSNLDAIAWFGENSSNQSHPVKRKQPNDWGLYDTLGNVEEWCLDWSASYTNEPRLDPIGRAAVEYPRASRGGPWMAVEQHCRASARRSFEPWLRMQGHGFRIAYGSAPPRWVFQDPWAVKVFGRTFLAIGAIVLILSLLAKAGFSLS